MQQTESGSESHDTGMDELHRELAMLQVQLKHTRAFIARLKLDAKSKQQRIKGLNEELVKLAAEKSALSLICVNGRRVDLVEEQ